MIKNEIDILEDYAEIIIRDKSQEVVARVKVDLDDLERVKAYNWSYTKKDGYAQNTTTFHKYGCRYLHQFVLGKKEGCVIDHINEDKQDCRKQNLRHVTVSENKQNVSKNKGVTWDKARNKWMAYITVKGKHIHLGRHDNYEDALEARRVGKEVHHIG